jgi:hypothetical protein
MLACLCCIAISAADMACRSESAEAAQTAQAMLETWRDLRQLEIWENFFSSDSPM